MAHESFSHVSLPDSPGRGIVLKVHSRFPVWTSNACTRPFVLLCVFGVPPSRNDDPISTTPLFVTAGVECTPISPLTRSIGWRLPNTAASFRSMLPVLPQELMTRAVL